MTKAQTQASYEARLNRVTDYLCEHLAEDIVPKRSRRNRLPIRLSLAARCVAPTVRPRAGRCARVRRATSTSAACGAQGPADRPSSPPEEAMTGRRPKPPQMPMDVARAFDAFPAAVRQRLLQVRGLIFETAARTDGVGSLAETLKWGEPAYLTAGDGQRDNRSAWDGSDRRTRPAQFCSTAAPRLSRRFARSFPATLATEKIRAILLRTSGALPRAPLAICLAMALTYHRRKTAA